MTFFEATALIDDENWEKIYEDRNDFNRFKSRVRRVIKKFNMKKEKNYVFISNLNEDEVECGIILTEKADVQKITAELLKAAGVKCTDISISETKFSHLQYLLDAAYRNNYNEDPDDVLARFGLYELHNYNYEGFDFDEGLINPAAKNFSYKIAEERLASETLVPELDRIYRGKSKSAACGHPVHYFIETDDKETRKDLTVSLLNALYGAGRIKNLRYGLIDLRTERFFSNSVYEKLYKICEGGAIVVEYPGAAENDEEKCARYEMEIIKSVCETMMKYRSRVLTVFCLPRVCKKIKKVFIENLGSTGMVDIREDFADTERAKAYFNMLCGKQRIRADKKLYKELEEGKTYLPDELRKKFEEWYNLKMKTSVYPQYKDVISCRKEAVKEDVRGCAYDDLNGMIGLNGAKSVISKALNYYKMQKIYKDKGVKEDHPAMHMLFTGNPGTAKTTVARLFARIMKENGLLSRGHLVEVGRSDLVGKYVGWTAQIVKEKFKTASGGVLFIDEAYSLVEERGGLYGDEAINTIVQEMENKRADLVVIFAGYPDKMEEFLNKNPGLRSRIAFQVPFADYDSKELCDIARMIGKSKGVTFTDGAVAKMAAIFDEARRQPDFGNGRYVRNVIELSKMNQASRILSMDPDNVTETALTSIEDVDIESPEANCKHIKRTIGFVS